MKLRGWLHSVALATSLTLRPMPRAFAALRIEQLMGGAPADVPARYAQGSPRALLPPTRQLLIVGAEDRVMPERARDAYAAPHSAAATRGVVVIPRCWSLRGDLLRPGLGGRPFANASYVC